MSVINVKNKLIEFIQSAPSENELCHILKALPLSVIKDLVIKEVKNICTAKQLQLYYKVLPMTDLLHDDMIQHIISFNEFEETRLINRKFKCLTEKNENAHYKQMYHLINKDQDDVNNKTYIVNQNKLSLHSIERELKYNGPYCDLEAVIKSCDDGDRILLHHGRYLAYDKIFIEKNIQIIGLTYKTEIRCDKSIYINSDNVRLQNIKILSDVKTHSIIIYSRCRLKAIDCTFESGCIWNTVYTLIFVNPEASLTLNNCKFREAHEAVRISPIAQHVIISKCHFVNIHGTHGCSGCVAIQDEDVFIDDNVGYPPSYVILKCTGNSFEKISYVYPFSEEFINGNDKRHSVYEKDCYIIEENVIIDEPNFDANKLYQVFFC